MGSACRRTGETCTTDNYCGSWTCHCQNTSVDFNTVGGCQGGTCTGTGVCTNICNTAGGVREALDHGCM